MIPPQIAQTATIAAIPALAVVLLVAGCGGSGSADGDGSAGKPVVYTTNYPLAYFAERIAGDAIVGFVQSRIR